MDAVEKVSGKAPVNTGKESRLKEPYGKGLATHSGPTAAAEPGEGRGSTKGNATETLLAPDSEPGKRGTGLCGVREAAKRDKKMRFNGTSSEGAM